MFFKGRLFKIFILLILALGLVSCSSPTKMKIKTQETTSKKMMKPLWVSSTTSFCSSQELCAVGEGTGRLVAEASARKELSKIFKVRVKVETNIDSSMVTSTDKDQVISGQMEEELTQQIQETSEECDKSVKGSGELKGNCTHLNPSTIYPVIKMPSFLPNMNPFCSVPYLTSHQVATTGLTLTVIE